MNHSENVAALAEALAKAQTQILPPVKSKTVKVSSSAGRSYSFSYAPLESVIAAVRGPFSENGLSFAQGVRVEQGKAVLSTMLMHASGQWIEGLVPLDIQQAGMQAMGSAISYARRYGLSNISGITADEDDDGNAADGNKVTEVVKPSPAKISQLRDKIVADKSGKLESTVKDFLDNRKVSNPAALPAEAFNDLLKIVGLV